MYRLRHFIEEGVDVDEALSSVKNELGKDLESLMDEALQSKCREDGQNLLMYAATHGNEAWLVRLVNDMRSRVSTVSKGEYSVFCCVSRRVNTYIWPTKTLHCPGGSHFVDLVFPSSRTGCAIIGSLKVMHTTTRYVVAFRIRGLNGPPALLAGWEMLWFVRKCFVRGLYARGEKTRAHPSSPFVLTILLKSALVISIQTAARFDEKL